MESQSLILEFLKGLDASLFDKLLEAIKCDDEDKKIDIMLKILANLELKIKNRQTSKK